MEDLENVSDSELIKILCERYDIEQMDVNQITPEYMSEYLNLVFKSLENIIKMGIRIHDPATATMAGLILKSMSMGPKLHNDLTLIIVKTAQEFIDNNS